MTTQPFYDKKKLIILRAVLVLIGGAVGGVAVWQYFEYFPGLMRKEFMILVIIVSAVTLGAILGISAKPLYRLGLSVADLFGALLSKLGARGMVGIVSGLLSAGMVVFLFDVMIRSVQEIWAVRLLMDILVYIVFASLCCYAITKWLAMPDRTEGVMPDTKVGYLLSASLITDDRALTAVDALINVNVTDGAYKALLLSGAPASVAKRLGSLIECGAVRLVRCRYEFSTLEEYADAERKIALGKRLRLIGEGGDISISAFSEPTEATRARLEAPDQAPEHGEEVSTIIDNGRIIIDK